MVGWRERSLGRGYGKDRLTSGGIGVGRKEVGEGDIEKVGGCRCQVIEGEGEAAGG